MISDRQTDRRTDICDSKVAFATEKSSYTEDLPITWEALDGFRQMQDHFGEVFHAYLGGEGGGHGPKLALDLFVWKKGS